jgi:hypothetical protein
MGTVRCDFYSTISGLTQECKVEAFKDTSQTGNQFEFLKYLVTSLGLTHPNDESNMRKFMEDVSERYNNGQSQCPTILDYFKYRVTLPSLSTEWNLEFKKFYDP